MRNGKLNGSHIWSRNTAAGRWYAFGRYYAMFPRDFIHDAVDGLTIENDVVIDPFCGRGNAPFVATVLQRQAVAIDNNPIAWLFTAAKQHPAPNVEHVTKRLGEIAAGRRRSDQRSRNRFENMAWAPDVRALLKTARRELQWRDSATDRTLMAFITLHMQDQLGSGLSNSLSPTIAFSPEYAVKWWTGKGMLAPPDIEPVAVLEDKIRRRYQHGVPRQARSRVMMGDSRYELPRLERAEARLLITSPPYRGVTDYWNDNWIRLWMLGHSFGKEWGKTASFAGRDAYRDLLHCVLAESKTHLADNASVLVRVDQRRSTAELCVEAMRAVWPGRELLMRPTSAPHAGSSTGHGRGGTKAKEYDLLIPNTRSVGWAQSRGFAPICPGGTPTIGTAPAIYPKRNASRAR